MRLELGGQGPQEYDTCLRRVCGVIYQRATGVARTHHIPATLHLGFISRRLCSSVLFLR